MLPAATLLIAAANVSAADLASVPANTWVEIQYTVEQPDPRDQGMFMPQGWNKLVYDPEGGRVLFYDRWYDKKHGGYTIYGNCLFGLDPAAGKLTPLRIDNWTKKDVKDGGYRTLALSGNDADPTPCPRHVYHAFDFVPASRSLYLCNGANQTVLRRDGKLVGHDLCDGLWRLDLKSNRWTRLDAGGATPPNRLDDALVYCPDINSLVYAGHGRQLWLFDLEKNRWRKAKNSPPPKNSMGQTLFYDPAKRRILIVGGGTLDAWTRKTGEFRDLYLFDPRTETVRRGADCPSAFYSTHLAYDSKRRLFFAVVVFDKGEQPSGMFCYDPHKDAWSQIKPLNPIPPHRSWFGWMKLCYDSRHDCLIGMVREKFYAFRYAP